MLRALQPSKAGTGKQVECDIRTGTERCVSVSCHHQCEAWGEPYDGKLAVGSVIMNRVRSSYFPNTVSGVIYQGGQFSPVASGRLAYRLEWVV